jgi:hypothetical protein
MKQLFICIAAGLIAILSPAASGKELVEAPGGWKETALGAQRIVSNGNATVTIHPWHSLQGRSPRQWLSGIVDKNPQDGVLLSIEDIKPETVPGAFSVSRRARFGEQKGYAILYLCPGQKGHARLMSLDVRDGGFGDLLKGALFGEAVCKREPKGAGNTTAEEQLAVVEINKGSTSTDSSLTALASNNPAENSVSDARLKTLNQKIPAVNRPHKASLNMVSKFKGFPAILTHEVVMVPEFNGGFQLSCTDWDPGAGVIAAELVDTKGCKVDGKKTKKLVSGFEPGQRVTLAFGNISGFDVDGIEQSATSMSGGDVVMSESGEIAIGSWRVNNTLNSTAHTTSTRRNNSLVGRYYLNGYTITIMSNEGEVHNGLIGYTETDSGTISALFINGKHYWDRGK